MLACATRLCFGQASFRGVVRDSISQTNVDAAFVTLSNTNKKYITNTDDQGDFDLGTVDPGVYTLLISHVSHETFVLKNFKVTMEQQRGAKIPFYVAPNTTLMGAAVINSVRATSTTPVTYSNLTKADIQNSDQGKDFPFLLNMTPSTVISSDAGNGVGYTGIRIRGIDPTRVNVTINGIPLNDGESQGVYWVNLPDLASSTQNVQVQRGVGTSTNGAASFGASVNVRTNNLSEKKYTFFNVGGGSFNTFRTTLAVGSGRLKNNWAFEARGSIIESDGFIDRATTDLRSLNLAAAKYGDKSTFKANILLGHERTYQAWYGIPQPKFYSNTAELNRYINQLWIGGGDLENLQNSNSRTYNFYTYENEVDNYNQNHYQLFYDRDLGKNLKLNTAAFVTTGQGYFEQFKADEDLSDYNLDNVITPTDTFTTADVIRRRWLDNTLAGMLASITYRKNKLSATLGAGASQFNNRHFGEAIATEFTGYEDLNAIYYDNDASKRDMNVYAKLKYQWRNWFPYVDIQARSINYQFEGLDNNLEFGNQEVDYLFFNPKVGLTYVLNNHSFYGMYAIGNREPVRDDFRNNKTDEWPEHEQLNNIEIGYRLQQGRKILNVNLYDMQYVNQLVLTGDVNDVGEAIRTNVDNSYRRGVEVEVQYPLSKRVQIGGNLTASQNKIESFTEHIGEWDDDFEVFTFEHKDKDISFSPNLISALVLSYQVNKHFSIDFFEKYVSKQYLDNTQSEERMLEAFWNLDASIKYTTTKIDGINALNIGLYINNALNAFYAPNGYTYGGYIGGERASFNYLYPMAGRNVMLKISAKL